MCLAECEFSVANPVAILIAEMTISSAISNPDFSLEDARTQFYARAGLPPDGGLSKSWVVVHIGKLPLAFPNAPSRKRAVPFHDAHHILTGFKTDIRGETLISAWELGAGCGNKLAAWVLNGLVLPLGLLYHPKELLRAYAWGSRCVTLYGFERIEQVLSRPVSELRSELGLDQAPPEPTRADRLGLVRMLLLSLTLHTLHLALLIGVALVLARLVGISTFG